MTVTDIKDPQTIEQWTRVLCDQEMPIFSNTVQNIYHTLDDKKKGAMELSSIILQDPNLTAKLLKVSSTPYYNPSNQKMSTVSRAIVILGSEVVRKLTLACSFFESIISPENKHHANQQIARAIHTAVQAKDIAIACKDPSPEEVFIAALLNNIGHIAFWCFGGKQCKYIDELIQSGNYSSDEAETKILGFTLSELSKNLSKSWKLGGLIEKSITYPSSSDSRVKAIQLGKEITHAIDLGWESEAMTSCIKKIKELSGQSQVAIQSQLKKNTDSAVKIAHKFGAHDASQYIQSHDNNNDTDPPGHKEFVDKKQIQFNILQDITQHISGQINLNELFEMVLEGIHRGVGMDRSLFCLLNHKTNTFNEKLAFGWSDKPNQSKIKLEISKFPANIFLKAIQSDEGIWATPKIDSALFTPLVINNIGKSECFLIPVYSNTNPIGLVYCDRSISNQPLTNEDFKAAKHFAQQAIIGLALYRIKK